MGYYRVIIQVEGLEVNSQSENYDSIKNKVIGFFTTRLVVLDDSKNLKEKAMAKVREEWLAYGDDFYLKFNDTMTVTLEDVEQIGWLRGIYQQLPCIPIIASIFHRFPTKGHTFYFEDP